LSSDRHAVLKAWIAAILWLILIAIESSALLSAHNTSRILYPLLHYLFGLDWDRFEVGTSTFASQVTSSATAH
jgi:hypothetical protein